MKKRLLSLIALFALMISLVVSALATNTGEVLSEGDVITSPPQKYWIIFNEGYRDGRIEMSAVDANADEKDLSILWDGGLTLCGTEEDDVHQYYFNDSGQWEFMRTYEVLSDWATDVIASNLDVYDRQGNLVLKKTEWNSALWNGDGRTLYYAGHTYYLYDTSEVGQWEEAKDYCESIGGHLATISDAQEDSTIFQYICSIGYKNAYFGYADPNKDGNWKWVTDEEITYTNWGSGEPNDCYGPEPYVGYYYMYPNGEWNDGDFGAGRTGGDGKAFICEWDSVILLDENGKPEVNSKEYTFEYFNQYVDQYVENEETAEYRFSFDPDWFVKSESSYKYNHNIAKASIAMAMAGANTHETQLGKFYASIGLKKAYYHYVAPTMDSIGYAIAQKKLTDGSTLIAITVRGGQYHSEWASNFTVGASGEHRGFSEAATAVVDGVLDYIKNNNITGKKKIWITGYSRAAATSNIAAKHLDVMAEQTHEIENLEAKDIYAYCFECPRTVINPPQTGLADNIFSIVNYLDVVPEVAPSIWGYTRYGKTLYLPGKEITSHKKYKTMFKNMEDEYQNILQSAGVNNSPKTSSLVAQGRILRTSVDALALYLGKFEKGQDGAAYYAQAYQNDFRAIGKNMRGERSALETEIKELLLMQFPFSWVRANLKPIGYILNETVAAAHYPELCLSWMNTLKSEKDFETLVDRVAKINCPVDVEVYDDEGILVAKIVDEEVQEIDGNSISAYIDDDGQKNISLPISEEYKIVICAREDCDVSYQVEETSLQTGNEARIVNYYDIEMNENEQMEASAPEVEPDLTEEYTIRKNNGNLVEPDQDTTENIKQYVMQVEDVENGYVQGGGIYVEGEFAEVSAIPDDGYVFTGWYENNTLVSQKSEYRFRMEKDHKIKAEFRQSDFLKGDCNNDKEINSKDLTVLARHLAKIQLITESQLLENADVNRDNSITAEDLTYLAKYVAKIIVSL